MVHSPNTYALLNRLKLIEIGQKSVIGCRVYTRNEPIEIVKQFLLESALLRGVGNSHIEVGKSHRGAGNLQEGARNSQEGAGNSWWRTLKNGELKNKLVGSFSKRGIAICSRFACT